MNLHYDAPPSPAPAPPPAPRRASAATLSGLVLCAFGLTVMAGWLLQVRAMVEFPEGMVAVVFNTALCFALSGAALALPGMLRRPLVALQRTAGCLLMLIAAAVLYEHLSDQNLGIDWAFLHIWLNDGNIRPGRFAPNTALGFMLAGACLFLLSHITARVRELLFQVLLFGLIGVGVTGLVGYVLTPDQLFGWARSARMAVPTAVGMLVIAVGLVGSFRSGAGKDAGAFAGLDEKISFVSAAILCVVALTAGLTGFVFQQKILESSLRERLQSRLDERRSIIVAELAQIRSASAHAAQDPHLLTPAAAVAQTVATALAAGTVNEAARRALDEELKGLIQEGFRSAALIAPDGGLLAQAGSHAAGPATLRLPLSRLGSEDAALAVEDGLTVLQTSTPVVHEGQVVARLDLVRPMLLTHTRLNDLTGLGATGEVVLCGGQASVLACLPTSAKHAAYVINRNNIAGQPLPMSQAVQGHSGLIATIDYKGKHVMAAFAPIDSNVGLVVKQETVELYGVIRQQLAVVVPVLLLLLGVGTALMRSQIKPLVARLIASEQRSRDRQIEINAVVGSVGEGIMTVNEQGIIESFNKAAASIYGYRPDEIIGKPATLLMPAHARGMLEDGLRDYLRTGDAKIIGRPKLEVTGMRKDGTEFTVELTISEIRLNRRRTFVGVVRDITERKHSEERLLFLAQHDILTGLPNRGLFMDRLQGAVLRATRSRTAMAVMFLDLDGFKHVNDTLGHHGGDLLLKQFAERLTQAVRKSDTVARLGGDEFTVILEGLSYPIIDTRDVADKIIAGMQIPFELGGQQISVTTSIGLAVHTGSDTDVDALLSRADDAMYRAKNRGKNRWSI